MKPILFNIEMVRAILDGRKTVTRRVIKPQPVVESGYDHPHEDDVGYFWKKEETYGSFEEFTKALLDGSPYQIGNILYVREKTYGTLGGIDNQDICYATHCPCGLSDEEHARVIGWRPSIHMPKEAARIFLKVTDVRVEKLQDITAEQARAEGIIDGGCLNCGESEPCNCDNAMPAPIDGFAHLWRKMYDENDEYCWHNNPWVWVIEFEVV